MSAETIASLLSFQPDAPELQQKREYDKEAREFVKQINALTPTTFLKGADSPQDPLNVCIDNVSESACLTSLGT
jgi:COP9 signalosome complex subunit 3